MHTLKIKLHDIGVAETKISDTRFLPSDPSLIISFLCLGQMSLGFTVKQGKREQIRLQISREGEEYYLHKLSALSLRPDLFQCLRNYFEKHEDHIFTLTGSVRVTGC